LIVGVQWCNGDVTNSSELTTVVQMLVFQPEKVPDEPPEITAIIAAKGLLLSIHCNKTNADNSTK